LFGEKYEILSGEPQSQAYPPSAVATFGSQHRSNRGNLNIMITFTSHASQKFSMQKDLAMVLLGVIGKTLGERGVITPEEMPHAIDRLKRAIKDDTHQAHIHVAELAAKEDEDGEEEPPHLGQRAYPLLHMLEESQVEQTPVMWGV
jgi:hypothetical protein